VIAGTDESEGFLPLVISAMHLRRNQIISSDKKERLFSAPRGKLIQLMLMYQVLLPGRGWKIGKR
jgi:hypothetical protein